AEHVVFVSDVNDDGTDKRFRVVLALGDDAEDLGGSDIPESEDPDAGEGGAEETGGGLGLGDEEPSPPVPTLATFGVQVGDTVEYRTSAGDRVSGVVDSINGNEVTIRYASSRPDVPATDGQEITFLRKPTLRGELRSMFGDLSDPAVLRGRFPTM